MIRTTLFVVSLIMVFLPSCSFFEPREPEDPDPGDEIPWQQPFAPSTVVINLENAMEGRSVAITMACCDTSYTFMADGADTTEFGGSWNFSNWNYQVEQDVLMSIYNSVQGSSLPEDSLLSVTMTEVSSLPDPVAPADSAEIWRDYEIVAAGSDYCGWDRPAIGRVKFFMVEDTYGLWYIKTWYDYRPDSYTGDNYTWGVAKATYR
jgi:hypothetical protein